jgi:hypothetical protein
MARIVLGDVRGGIELLTAGLARWRAAGFELDRPYWLAGLADGHRRLGDLGAATAAVDEGLEHIARCGEHVWAPELYAVRAGIERASASAVVPARARERAIADLERSIAIARAQGAGLFQRRAREVLQHMGEDT